MNYYEIENTLDITRFNYEKLDELPCGVNYNCTNHEVWEPDSLVLRNLLIMSVNYLREDQNHKKTVLESLGIKEDDLKRDVNIIRDWASKQEHLPKVFLNDDAFMERVLLNNKFRIEKSKLKYDNYFTLKTVYNSFYDGIENIVPSTIPIVKFPLRNLSKDGKRIILVCVSARNKHESIELNECLKFQLGVSEIMQKYLFVDGKIAIFDFADIRAGLIKNFDVLLLHKHLKIIKHSLSGRISVLHIVNMSNFVSFVLNGVKMVFTEISSKIKIHDSWESLYKEVPKELLPRDYGGDDISVAEYMEIWDNIFKEEETFLKSLRSLCTDESLRKAPCQFYSQEFGLDGTFKKLNID